MKKWIIFGIIGAVALSAFVLCSNNLAKEEKYCTYTQTLFYDDENKLLEGKQVVEFFNYTDSILNEVYLHLYANAFREGASAKVVLLANFNKAYPNGASYGDIQIESVSSNGEYLQYDVAGVDENILVVTTGKEIYPDDFFTFEIGFSVQLANINHRLGYGANTINLCNYYPIVCVYEEGEFVTDLYHSNGDPFYSKIANYEVSITYDEEFKLAHTGEKVKSESEEGKTTTTIKAGKVRDFAMVLSPKFSLVSESYKGIQIDYYYYNDQNYEQSFEVIKQLLSMNEKFGAYPYKTLTVCEANFVHGGMEYPNLVLIADNLADYDTYVNVVVHELCHQWWYGVVGNNQYKYGFLDEGLTDYNTALFYDTYPAYNHTSKEIFENATKSYCNFVKIYSDVVPEFSTSMVRGLNEFATENEYVYLSYVKGMLLFSGLKDLLGEKKMNSAIKYYYECNKFSEATPQDLIDCFSRSSGKNLESYFNSWFNGEVVLGEF